jgi:hypothetical protein
MCAVICGLSVHNWAERASDSESRLSSSSIWVQGEASPLQLGMSGHRRWGKPDTWKHVIVADVMPDGASGTNPDLSSSIDDSLDQNCVRMIRVVRIVPGTCRRFEIEV